jgi:hypothetical protein
VRRLRRARIFGRIWRLSALAELRVGAGSPISVVGAGTSQAGALSTGISVTARDRYCSALRRDVFGESGHRIERINDGDMVFAAS